MIKTVKDFLYKIEAKLCRLSKLKCAEKISVNQRSYQRVSASMKTGFTFIEMIVVVSIIIIISTTGLISFTEQRNRVDLILSAQEIANDLRKARNLAMISSKYDMGSGLEVPCGYGISFDPGNKDAYILFAGNNADTGDCGTTDKSYDPAPAPAENDMEVENISLPSQIIISNADFDVFFEPPYSATTIISSGLIVDSIVITLQIKGRSCPDYCKNVTITSSGKIEY